MRYIGDMNYMIEFDSFYFMAIIELHIMNT